jgi:hypothetical protein
MQRVGQIKVCGFAAGIDAERNGAANLRFMRWIVCTTFPSAAVECGMKLLPESFGLLRSGRHLIAVDAA